MTKRREVAPGIYSGTPEALAWAMAGMERAQTEDAERRRVSAAMGKRRDGAAKANAKTHPQFYLRGLADRLGVELASVKATGQHGRITRSDVVAAGRGVEVEVQPVAASPSASPAHQAGEVGPRNPLVAAAWQERPTVAARAANVSSAPTLFSAGDLPDFTASGVDPSVLLRVPWNARPALAAEPDKAKVYESIELFNGVTDPGDAEALAKDHGLQSGAVAEYASRVKGWMLAAASDDEIMTSLGYEG